MVGQQEEVRTSSGVLLGSGWTPEKVETELEFETTLHPVEEPTPERRCRGEEPPQCELPVLSVYRHQTCSFPGDTVSAVPRPSFQDGSGRMSHGNRS